MLKRASVSSSSYRLRAGAKQSNPRCMQRRLSHCSIKAFPPRATVLRASDRSRAPKWPCPHIAPRALHAFARHSPSPAQVAHRCGGSDSPMPGSSDGDRNCDSSVGTVTVACTTTCGACNPRKQGLSALSALEIRYVRHVANASNAAGPRITDRGKCQTLAAARFAKEPNPQRARGALHWNPG